jgi:hypothetical protein
MRLIPIPVWHTSLLIYKKEWFYDDLVLSSKLSRSGFGTPALYAQVGVTFLNEGQWTNLLVSDATLFDFSAGGKYSITEHNCNHFTEAAIPLITAQKLPMFSISGVTEGHPISSQAAVLLDRFTARESRHRIAEMLGTTRSQCPVQEPGRLGGNRP